MTPLNNSYILAAKLGLQLFKILQTSMRKTSPEKRREAMLEFDKALEKSKKEGSTKELEAWLLKNL